MAKKKMVRVTINDDRTPDVFVETDFDTDTVENWAVDVRDRGYFIDPEAQRLYPWHVIKHIEEA